MSEPSGLVVADVHFFMSIRETTVPFNVTFIESWMASIIRRFHKPGGVTMLPEGAT